MRRTRNIAAMLNAQNPSIGMNVPHADRVALSFYNYGHATASIFVYALYPKLFDYTTRLLASGPTNYWPVQPSEIGGTLIHDLGSAPLNATAAANVVNITGHEDPNWSFDAYNATAPATASVRATGFVGMRTAWNNAQNFSVTAYARWGGGTGYLLVDQNASQFAQWLITSSGFLQYVDSGGNSVNSTGQLAGNAWTHCALVKSGTTMNFYINGAPVGAPVATAHTGYTLTETVSGWNTLPNIQVNHIAFYANQALTAAEILGQYQAMSLEGYNNPLVNGNALPTSGYLNYGIAKATSSEFPPCLSVAMTGSDAVWMDALIEYL